MSGGGDVQVHWSARLPVSYIAGKVPIDAATWEQLDADGRLEAVRSAVGDAVLRTLDVRWSVSNGDSGGTPLECTGVAASWCPIHGTCTCPRDELDKPWPGGLNDPNCPLHSPGSNHAEGLT